MCERTSRSLPSGPPDSSPRPWHQSPRSPEDREQTLARHGVGARQHTAAQRKGGRGGVLRPGPHEPAVLPLERPDRGEAAIARVAVHQDVDVGIGSATESQREPVEGAFPSNPLATLMPKPETCITRVKGCALSSNSQAGAGGAEDRGADRPVATGWSAGPRSPTTSRADPSRGPTPRPGPRRRA